MRSNDSERHHRIKDGQITLRVIESALRTTRERHKITLSVREAIEERVNKCNDPLECVSTTACIDIVDMTRDTCTEVRLSLFFGCKARQSSGTAQRGATFEQYLRNFSTKVKPLSLLGPYPRMQ